MVKAGFVSFPRCFDYVPNLLKNCPARLLFFPSHDAIISACKKTRDPSASLRDR